MKHKVKIGGWFFELKRIKGVKVDEYGKPYNAVVDIVIADGELHIEGLLARSDVKHNYKEDLAAIEALVTMLGFKEYTSSHFENGVLIKDKKTISRITPNE